MSKQAHLAGALRHITETVILNSRPEKILAEVLRIVGTTLAVDRALIFEVSLNDRLIKSQCEYVAPDRGEISSVQGSYPLDIFVNGVQEMQRTHQPIISHDNDVSPYFRTDGSGELLHQALQVRSGLWLPLAFSEQGFYVLALHHIFAHHAWSEDELEFGESAGQLVSVALDKVHLLDDKQNLRNSLQNTIQSVEKMRESLQTISQAVEQSLNVIVLTDVDARIEYVNAAFVKANGYTLEEVKGRTPRVLNSRKTPRAVFDEMWLRLQSGESWQGEFINKRKDGSEYVSRARITPVRGAYGKVTHYLAIQEDITEKQESDKRIEFLARFDPLTGLPNRAQLEERLNVALGSAKRNSEQLSVVMFDLDHFKGINDTLGHAIGDAVLAELAQRVSRLCRPEDALSRFAGDEFILITPNFDAASTVQVAQRLLEIIAEPFFIESHELHVTGSVGIAVYPNDGESLDVLIKNAEAAMYRSKKEGRHGYRFFTQEMQQSTVRAQQLFNALRQALSRDQLKLYYQPQLSVETGKVIGAEALLRWQHPELGFVSPAEFIPIAEEGGLIVSIGEWVMRTAVHQAKAWIDQGLPPIIMAVNLSAIQFRQENLPDLVSRILEDESLPPEYLELELTEGVAMNDPQGAINMMNNLHDRGIRMSIDDFGTGYSSLSYLKKFKIYKLKIDQSFVRDISTDAEDKAIVSAIINLSRSLGLQTIAEGVETAAQLAFLKQQGCNEVQGYFYSKPVPAADFEAYLKSNNQQ